MSNERGDAEARIEELRNRIRALDKKYYQAADPEVLDRAYDRLKEELVSLEQDVLGVNPEDSPTTQVGDDRLEGFDSYRHRDPMLSLDNTYNREDLLAFDQRLRKRFEVEELDYTVDPKIDGLAIPTRLDRIARRGLSHER